MLEFSSELSAEKVEEELRILITEGIVREFIRKNKHDNCLCSYEMNDHYHFDFEEIEVLCLNADSSLSLRCFSSVVEASSQLGINIKNILRVCRRLQQSEKNLCFRWLDGQQSELTAPDAPLSVREIRDIYMTLNISESCSSNADTLSIDSNKQCTQNVTYSIIRRPGYPKELEKYVCRRFKKESNGGDSEIFLVTHVCSFYLEPGKFFYRYYSISEYPNKRPTDEAKYCHGPAYEMSSPMSWAIWIPIGTHISSVNSSDQIEVTGRKRMRGRPRRSSIPLTDINECKGTLVEDLSSMKHNVETILTVIKVFKKCKRIITFCLYDFMNTYRVYN